MRKSIQQSAQYFFLICSIFLFSAGTITHSFAANSDFNSNKIDRIFLAKEQLQVLHQRISQAQAELSEIQKQAASSQETLLTISDKKKLDQMNLAVEFVKSNWQAVNMEVLDAKQSVQWLEHHVEEIQHQINILNALGVKNVPDELNLENMRQDQNSQQELLLLERNRLAQLQVLQNVIKNIYQIRQERLQKIIYLQKTQQVSLAEKKQLSDELYNQRQQSYWLNISNELDKKIGKAKEKKKSDVLKLEEDIFYANQQAYFFYLKSLLARYEHQTEDIDRLSSKVDGVNLLNEMRLQVLTLNEQSNHLIRLIQNRIHLMETHAQAVTQIRPELNSSNPVYHQRLLSLKQNYQNIFPEIDVLKKNLAGLQVHLEQLLKLELSARRGFANFGWRTFFDVGKEIILLPKLVYQFAKNNVQVLKQDLLNIGWVKWILIILVEIILIGVFIPCYRWLRETTREFYGSLVNMDARNLFLMLLSHQSIDLFVSLQILAWAALSSLPSMTNYFIRDLVLLWLFSKGLLKIFRMYTVESIVVEEKNILVRYRLFKYAIVIGALLTVAMLFMLQLPLIDELKLMIARVLLVYLLVVAICWLRYSRLLSALVLFHIHASNPYINNSIKLIGFLLPMLLLMNSVLGLLGYFNLITNIAKYEGIFLLVLFAYLILRGLLTDALEYLSQWTIQHAKNGWLISESILKPINKVCRLILFIASVFILFLLYGWDKQSPAVARLNEILHYPFVSILNSSINLITVSELFILITFFYWAARWMREFMYRFLSSRTGDIGVRNSLAILSQYAVVVMGIFTFLHVLGIDYRALAFIISAFALGAGLGLRDLINNFACGFLILLERPLRVGDIVQIGEEQGEVIHFGSRAVTIRTDNYLEMIVPNSEIFSKTFINWTASNNTVRIVIPFFCDAQNDPNEIKSLIEELLQRQTLILSFPLPEVFFKRIIENKIEFELRYYVDIRKVGTRAKATSALLTAIFAAFKEKGYKLPTNEHHIYLKNDHENDEEKKG